MSQGDHADVILEPFEKYAQGLYGSPNLGYLIKDIVATVCTIENTTRQ